MRSCFGLMLMLLVVGATFGCGALLWYLSSTAEFSRDPSSPVRRSGVESVTPPAAASPVHPD